MAKFPRVFTLCTLLSTLACGGGEAGRTSFGSEAGVTLSTSIGDPETSEANSTDPSTTNDPSDTTDGSSSATTGLKLDTLDNETSMGTADDGGGMAGCKAIDFLFVIDNSGSMGDNQQNLIASFPGFISKIQQVIADVDSYHIMVVKTDQLWNTCTIECNFFPLQCTFGGVNGCNGAPTVCDDTMGAGVNFPLGDGASNQYCNLTGGQRYITPQEPLAALPQRFTCIASVGTNGDSSEQPMASLNQAISPGLNGPGGCNSGFLRDDAVLVVTIITDEEDDASPGSPAGWYANVIAQKIDTGVVVLGLINDQDGVCPVDSQNQVRLRSFIDMFPNHIYGSVCAADYAPFFEQAVDLINTTCDEFVPVG